MTDPTAESLNEETRDSPEGEGSGPAENEAVSLEPSEAPVNPVARDPARMATLVVLALCVVFFVLYLRADRVMPYSDQAPGSLRAARRWRPSR